VSDCIVINTGPLITLDRIGALDVAGQLPFSFVCPSEVREELDEGHRAGYQAINPAWLQTEALVTPLSPLGISALDKGEAAVIQLAVEEGIEWVCIDEWKGRRAAAAVGLKVTGVLGLLSRAKKEGIIGALRPFVDRAVSCGIRYHAELAARVLEAAGE